jgi:hypothetical protein
LPLLGIGKKKEAVAAEEVPEELPDLPQSDVNPGDQQGASVPDELPDAGELAPDELPPATAGEIGIDNASEVDTNLTSMADKRLYFSNLLQKLQDDGLKSTKLVSPSADLLSDMKKFWKEKRKTDMIDAMKQELEKNVFPLQKLEKEWADLYDDIEQKKKLLREKEKSIQAMGETLKTLARQTDKAANPGKK